jgi:hypothetical protein
VIIERHPDNRLLVVFLEGENYSLPDTFDWLVWGFGERPVRIFYWTIFVIGGFSLSYYTGENQDLKGNVAESLSCSAFNFATIGCRHSGPVDTVVETIGTMRALFERSEGNRRSAMRRPRPRHSKYMTLESY